MSVSEAQTRVAIMAATEQNHSHLSALLGEAGLNVVMHEVVGEDFIRQLENTSVDVLLVDLSDDDTDSEVDVIDTLLEYDSVPVFFNDSSKAGGETNAMWAKKLARKLEKIARDYGQNNDHDLALAQNNEQQSSIEDKIELTVEKDGGLDNSLSEIDSEFSFKVDSEFSESSLEHETASLEAMEFVGGSEAQAKVDESLANEGVVNKDVFSQENEYSQEVKNFSSPQSKISEEITSLQKHDDAAIAAMKDKLSLTEIPDGAAVNVWVLGASLGGPQAVRQFLMTIKEDLPVAFILAQHIGENHISLLGEQLDRVSKFRVFPAYNGHMIRHQEVILAPAGKNIHITGDGYISLSDQEPNVIYSPCINDVMKAVATRYGNLAGTIVFSGMGDDGATGCQVIAENGGIVWAQDVESCVISSMPDQARMTNNVTFSANPGKLADELYKYYAEEF